MFEVQARELLGKIVSKGIKNLNNLYGLVKKIPRNFVKDFCIFYLI